MCMNIGLLKTVEIWQHIPVSPLGVQEEEIHQITN